MGWVAVACIALLSATALGYFAGNALPALAGWSAASAGREPIAPSPGSVDIGFLQDMARHHHQAVLMSLMALTRAGPTVRGLATSILVSQSRQIGLMRGWLQLWDAPMQPAHMAWMSDRAASKTRHTTHHGMPGMASPKELRKLRHQAGQAFNILFMQLMLRHHLGGIKMARYALEHATLERVRPIARVMIVEQAKEVARMRALLKAAGAEPLFSHGLSVPPTVTGPARGQRARLTAREAQN